MKRGEVATEDRQLRFHWMLPEAGGAAMKTPEEAARFRVEKALEDSPAAQPDLEGWERFARAAEQAGIESVLISFSRYEPDPMFVSCALGRAVEKLKFIVAYRSGLSQPTTFVQQFNTLSTLVNGRVALNLVAGSSRAEQHAYGDFLEHDERYARAEEFLEVCSSFWRDWTARIDFQGRFYRVEQGHFHTPFFGHNRTTPEIYISGHSSAAEKLAHSQGSCWLRCAEAPEKLAPIVAQSRAAGVEVGLRLCVLCRPTREEAVAVAESLVPHCQAGMSSGNRDQRDDSTMYRNSSLQNNSFIGRSLWTGLVSLCGPVWTTLLGTPREIADLLLEYKRIGVSQFIMSGWPEVDEVTRFGREVLPLVRKGEQRLLAFSQPLDYQN
ncbi:MAG TPA: LLM class flavin-dependent oxidoreductase [Chthoniobacterales bacterium]|nr:LLM class flavin-dependent oxidoreductase [Chthoniobacterales bacterium]